MSIFNRFFNRKKSEERGKAQKNDPVNKNVRNLRQTEVALFFRIDHPRSLQFAVLRQSMLRQVLQRADRATLSDDQMASMVALQLFAALDGCTQEYAVNQSARLLSQCSVTRYQRTSEALEGLNFGSDWEVPVTIIFWPC